MNDNDKTGAIAWHAMKPEQASAKLQVDKTRGLSEDEARRRLAEYGTNELVERGAKSVWAIVWEQLAAFLIIILIIAAVISLALGEWTDSVAILLIVVLNTVIGVTQEYRAEKAMAALKQMAAPTVRARRGSHLHEISAKDLVPGDIVLLDAGASVPADGRLLEAFNLKTQEAALTGESEAVDKDANPVVAAAELADRTCMVYLGTAVTYGRGTMLVTATGMQTELGRIATLLQTVFHEATPLQKKLNQLGRLLTYVAVAIIVVVGFVQHVRGANLEEIFLSAVSLAVAAVPEGLPAVVTISLALGAQRMLRRRVLIRKLTAVETLGSVTTICSDKTGTLTENRMTVVALQLPESRTDLRESRAPGDVTLELPALVLLAGSALCSDAVLEEGETPKSIGDPTEGALVVAAAKAGLKKPQLEQLLPRVGEVPFDSDRKRMTTLHSKDARSPRADTAEAASPRAAEFLQWAADQGAGILFTKGSVDGLLRISDRVWTHKVEPMTEQRRQQLQEQNTRLAADGIRVLGLAYRATAAEELLDQAVLEQGLIFVGMVGMIDPVRTEAPAAVQKCRDAGIRVMMITGDHPMTARHIARELKMIDDGQLLTGAELEALPEDILGETVRRVSVYARVSPEHKLRIVQGLQATGQVVAMTGDGVNDAPALKKANIGVAMGITGTDVSKEASDMVLQDDNFSTIVSAVEEGRIIYDNIRRFIRYILATNSGEIWIMLGGPLLFDMTLPLLPVQILWMNLVTDGLPALALAVEPAERNVMQRPPRRANEAIVNPGMGIHVVWVGLLMAIVALNAGAWRWMPGDESSWRHAQTMLFTITVFLQLGHAMAIRSIRDSLFTQGLLSNKPLLIGVIFMVLLQIAVVYAPILQRFFDTIALTGREFVACLILGSAVFWAVELEKFIIRRTRLESRVEHL